MFRDGWVYCVIVCFSLRIYPPPPACILLPTPNRTPPPCRLEVIKKTEANGVHDAANHYVQAGC
jgi:hypothetical protein